MPKLELGDLPSGKGAQDKEYSSSSETGEGRVCDTTAVPSCTLMYKQELPLMFPGG